MFNKIIIKFNKSTTSLNEKYFATDRRTVFFVNVLHFFH